MTKKMTFGERLVMLRKKAGLTQDQVAKKAGITREVYNSYEKGIRTPRLEYLKRLADALETDYNGLIGDWPSVLDVKAQIQEAIKDLEELRDCEIDICCTSLRRQKRK